MTKQEILDVLQKQPDVAWLQNTEDGRIICAAPHVLTAYQSVDPNERLWKRLTPEQVRDAIGQNRKPFSGEAQKRAEIPAPASAPSAMEDSDFEHTDNPALPKVGVGKKK